MLNELGQARAKGQPESELEASLEAELADVLAQALLIGQHFGDDVQRAAKRSLAEQGSVAAAGEGDDGLGVPFALSSFAVIHKF